MKNLTQLNNAIKQAGVYNQIGSDIASLITLGNNFIALASDLAQQYANAYAKVQLLAYNEDGTQVIDQTDSERQQIANIFPYAYTQLKNMSDRMNAIKQTIGNNTQTITELTVNNINSIFSTKGKFVIDENHRFSLNLQHYYQCSRHYRRNNGHNIMSLFNRVGCDFIRHITIPAVSVTYVPSEDKFSAQCLVYIGNTFYKCNSRNAQDMNNVEFEYLGDSFTDTNEALQQIGWIRNPNNYTINNGVKQYDEISATRFIKSTTSGDYQQLFGVLDGIELYGSIESVITTRDIDVNSIIPVTTNILSAVNGLTS